MCKERGKNLRAIAGTIATLAGIVCLAGPVKAQSTDVGHPTPLTTNSIKGSLERQNNFYSFQAGPGELSVALFVEACPSCFAKGNVQLFSGNGVTPLCKLVEIIATNGATQQGACTVQLNRRQLVMLRVGRADGGASSSFQVRVGGAVDFDSRSAGAREVSGATGGPSIMIINMKDGSARNIDLSQVAEIIFR